MPPIAQSVNQLDTSASDPRLDKGLTGKELLRLLRKRDCVELRQRGPTSSSSATNAKRSCPCTRERIWAPVFCGPSSATSNHVSERGGCGRRLRISRGHRSFLPDQHGLVATLNFYERKAARIRAVRDLGHNGVTSCRLASGTFEPSCGIRRALSPRAQSPMPRQRHPAATRQSGKGVIRRHERLGGVRTRQLLAGGRLARPIEFSDRTGS